MSHPYAALKAFSAPIPKQPRKLVGMWLHYLIPGKSVAQGQILKVSTERGQFAMQQYDWLLGYPTAGGTEWISLAALDEHVALYFSNDDMRRAWDSVGVEIESARAAAGAK